MKTLVWVGPNEMEIKETEIPKIKQNEVLVEVDVVGICGSEIEGFIGHNSLRVPPLVMGHEFCGYIAEIGENVSGLKEGQKVIVNPLIACGTCDRCIKGKENLCDNRSIVGIHRPGAFAQFVAVPASSVHVIPNEFSSYDAALAEPLACSLRGVRRALATEPFANVLVYGAGTIGLLSAFVAQILGTNKVIVADINEDRLKNIQNVGITNIINAKTTNMKEEINKVTKGKGIDVIIDAAGFIPTRQEAMELINSGGVILNIGLGVDETPLPINDQIRREVTILGTFTYTAADFKHAIQLLLEGKISHVGWSEKRPLTKGQEAFTELVKGEVTNSKIFLEVKGVN